MSETVLIVDDEDTVRRTFEEWLLGSGLKVRVLTAHDAESALAAASQEPIDLAILDWNLGAGSDGLRLLEDLIEFQPDLVAILVTGYAAQATPLDALRKGVRDYFDKNQNLTRDLFLESVRRQLDRIVPAKRQREVNASLATFREAVDKLLPLVRGSSELNDPLPLPAALQMFVRGGMDAAGAVDGCLVLIQPGGIDLWDAAGEKTRLQPTHFHRTLAAAALSRAQPMMINLHDLRTNSPNSPDSVDSSDTADSVELLAIEQNRRHVLAIPFDAWPGSQAVLELFDPPGFTESDQRWAAFLGRIGAELLRRAGVERQTQRVLLDAVEAALQASRQVSGALSGIAPPSDPPPQAVMEALQRGLAQNTVSIVDAATGLELVEAVRELAVRHGPDAVAHVTAVVRNLRQFLDRFNGPAP